MSKNFINVNKFRSFFPILNSKINGYPLIYFDNAATAQIPQQVVDAMNDYYLHYKSNIGRGVYTFAEKSTTEYEKARQQVANFIGADKENIVFTSGATASINLVADSWAAYNLKAGDEILVSAVEHHSNFLPWQELSTKLNLVLKIIPVDSYGFIDFEQFEKMLNDKTALISIVHSSNVTGITHDVSRVCQIAKEKNIAVLVDACQSIAHQKINVQAIDCDFLVFSGHKLFGPTGVGVLYASSNRIGQMRPTEFGGGMVFSVNLDHSEYKSFPRGFEAGTPNIAGVIGLGEAIGFVEENIDFKEIQEHETMLVSQMTEGLKTIAGLKIISIDPSFNKDIHAYLVTFISDKYHAHDIAAFLDRYGIAVRAGNHCVQLYHQQCNLQATVRISFSIYNTKEEVNFVLARLQEFLA
jgi:cysteine desulfurase / selenocysteine lyase